jgi:hypothetical protein
MQQAQAIRDLHVAQLLHEPQAHHLTLILRQDRQGQLNMLTDQLASSQLINTPQLP